MSNTIQTAMVKQYHSNVTFLYQQEGSVLRGLSRVKQINARYDFFDRIGPTAAVKKTVRHGDTPLVNTQHTRRRGELVDYEWADLIDKQDELRILIDPKSAYTVNAAMAMGRAYDEEFIEAFTANAYEGEDGGTVTAFPTGNIIDDGGGSAGLTVDKLQSAKLALDLVPVPAGDRWFVASPEAYIDLLADPKVTSTDYNVVKALVSGTIEGQVYMGFHYVSSILLPVVSDIRECYAWHMNAMGMLVGQDLVTRITERDDKSFATQVYVSGSFKGIRTLDEGVRVVDIDESV